MQQRQQPPSPVTPSTTARKDVATLSPFAQLVLDATKIAHSYPSPERSSPQAADLPTGLSIAATAIRRDAPAKCDDATTAQEVVRRQPVVIIPRRPPQQPSDALAGAIKSEDTSIASQQPLPLSQGSQKGPTVILSKTLTPAERAKYHVVEEDQIPSAPTLSLIHI